MDAWHLLEGMAARGLSVSLEGEHLAVSPKSYLTPKLCDALKAPKSELVSLLQCGDPFALAVANAPPDAPEEHAQNIEKARLRLKRLDKLGGSAGAGRAICRASRRLEGEQGDFWRRLSASERHTLAVCAALLDAEN